VAEPRGGIADAAEHNEGWTESPYTSWSTREEEAQEWAVKGATRRGVVMRVSIRAVANRLVESPDLKDEAEVLIRGAVNGAKVYFL
jgi:hypothetical protein